MDTKKANSLNSIRQARNAAEKQRRDKLNTFISDLANIVPFTPYANKRLDKISILRLSAAYLRLHLKYNFLNVRTTKNMEISEMDMMNKIIETSNGFMLLLNNDRKIILASHNCLNYLGHQDIDMIGNVLDAFVHPFEIDMISDELGKLKNEINRTNSSKSRPITLRFRMKTRTQPKTEYPNYQFVQMSGYMVDLSHETVLVKSNQNLVFSRQKSHPYLRSSCQNGSRNCCTNSAKLNGTKIISQPNSKKVNLLQSNSFDYQLPSYNQNLKYLFIGFIQTIQRESFEQLTLFESLQDEYTTLFSLDCQLIAADHRISNITGFLPKEIINSYLNQYIHSNDQLISKIAHQMMLDSADGTGKIVHRIRTKSGQYVWIESIGRLNFDESRTPHNFICYNRLLSDADGDKERAKLVAKFSLQSMNPHQTNDHIPFEYQNWENINTNIDINSLSNSDQNINLKNEANSAKGLVLKVDNLPIDNQLDHLNSSYFEMDQNLVQNPSPFSFLIVNQFDANNLVQQPVFSPPNSLSSNSASSNGLSFNCLSTDHFKPSFTDSGLFNEQLNFSNHQIFNLDNSLVTKDSVDQLTNQTLEINQMMNENSEQQLKNKTENEIQTLNFLDLQCPNSSGSSFNNHPVKCY